MLEEPLENIALTPPIYHVNTHTFRHQKVFLNPEYEDFVGSSFVTTTAIWDIQLMELGIMPSHVHFLIRVSLEMPLPRSMNLLKGRVSRELGVRYPDLLFDLGGHLWSTGYYETRIKSAEQYENTLKYIRDQKIHGGLV